MNILILSCGTRNKIVQYFKKEFSGFGKVVATDTSLLAPALYEADSYYIVPKISDENYIETILSICKKEEIELLFSLIDPELSLIAKNKKLFKDNGCTPLISNSEIVDLCFDKMHMFEYLKKSNIQTPKTYCSLPELVEDLNGKSIQFPLFAKPRNGSASIGISVINNMKELETVFSQNDEIIVQEYMQGKEFGVDAYIDMISGELVSLFIKEKVKMRAGETDKSISVKNEKIESMLIDFVKKTNFRGVIDIDIFENQDQYYLSEVNPRFGGGYPHAYGSGVNFPKLIKNNMLGFENPVDIGNYDEDIYMLKYNEVRFLRK